MFKRNLLTLVRPFPTLSEKDAFETWQHTKCVSMFVMAALLAACGGTGQDEGVQGETSQTFGGRVIDGYLARATVFVDSNNNGTRDAWEAWAFTDNDGYYSFNPKTNTNYCASDATAQQSQYCLISNVRYSNVVVRIDAGYDVITGEPFLGQLSRRINAQDATEDSSSIVSPITSLLTNVEEQTDREALLTSLDINETDLDVDYLNTDGNNSVNAPLLNTALKIHKVVAVLSDRLTDTYTEIGEDFGTPNDASSSVYRNLAEQIINSNAALDSALANESTLVATLDAAETSLREVYERKEFELPADMGSASNPGAFERVVEVATQLPSVVNNLIDTNDMTFNLDDAIGSSRALETLVIKSVNETGTPDASINNVINFFDTSNDENPEEGQNLVNALLSSLTQNSADISALVSNDFIGDDFDSAEEISSASSFGEDVRAFSQIGGLRLKISELDLGKIGDEKDKEVEFYFNGEADSIDGAFQACVKYVELDENRALKEATTKGELVDGFWSLLGSSEENVESFSLLITLTFLGTTYQAILKPAGDETIDNVTYKRMRFDNDGELTFWHSLAGFSDIGTIPSSNTACEENLPSRIGFDQ